MMAARGRGEDPWGEERGSGGSRDRGHQSPPLSPERLPPPPPPERKPVYERLGEKPGE